MKDFAHWLTDNVRDAQGESKAAQREAHEYALEDSDTCWRMKDGSWRCRCCCCGENFDMPVGPEEVQVGQEFYCGSGPSCCP